MQLLICLLIVITWEYCDALSPIIIRGNKMYNSDSGERFYMKGITYGYAVDDEYYDRYGREVIDTYMEDLKGHYNTIRVYNINPEKSYSEFMNHMDEIGVYVLIGASPANDPYFGKYRYSTMRKDLGANGAVKTDSDGKKTLDLTESCYPALLLEYGKRITRAFAAYDNTLGIIVANEIMQRDLTAAACVKQYVSDLKNWMRVNGKKMRLIPLSFAIADSAHTSGQDADAYGATKLQGLLCDDVMTNGLMYQSIDILLINSYRWCEDSTFATAYDRIVRWTTGSPIVIALGEFGCKIGAGTPREFNMLPFLFGTNTANQDMHEIFSGGTAYSYGQANQPSASLFPLFLGGSTELTGEPSNEKTVDFDNLVSQYSQITPVPQEAAWDSDDKCSWVPPIETSVSTSIVGDGWITTCSNVVLEPGDTWKTSSRNGAVCSSDGSACDVSVTSKVGTTEVELCGFVDNISGGAPCNNNNDCGRHGICTGSGDDKVCECLGCYSGTTCDIIDTGKCAELSSSDIAPPIVFGGIAIAISIICIVFASLYTKAQKHSKETSNIRKRLNTSPDSEDTAVSM